jgi:adenosine deaminase
VCPGSNVALGLYRDRLSHPIDALRRAQVPVSINSDDPGLLRTGLVAEYLQTAVTHGWDLEILRAMARTSIEASFCPEDLRRGFLRNLAGWRPAG